MLCNHHLYSLKKLNKVNWKIVTLIHLFIVYGYFCLKNLELSSCNRNYMDDKPKIFALGSL